MSNVISFEDGKRRHIEKIASSNQKPDLSTSQREAPSTVDASFEREAKAFRFKRMIPPAVFVKIDSSKLPPYFPPDPPPPMAA